VSSTGYMNVRTTILSMVRIMTGVTVIVTVFWRGYFRDRKDDCIFSFKWDRIFCY